MKRARPGSSPSRKNVDLRAEPRRRVELAHRVGDRQRVRRVGEPHLAVGLEVGGRLAVGDDEQHRLGVGVLAEEPVGEQQPVVEVGALVPARVEAGELLDLHHLGVPAEGDQLEVVAAEARADQLVQGQRGALHRHPAPVHRHRERRVDEQRDGRLGAGLGLDDLDVVDLEPHRATRRRSRSTALVIVRGTSHGSVSPNSHRRVAPDGSPASPVVRVSRAPERPLIRSATSRSSALPSWRIALGESRSSPSDPRLR